MTVTLATARGEVRSLLDEPSAWARLERRSVRDEDTGCWLWMGPPSSEGYGYLRIERSRWYCHILAYTLTHGPPPDDKDVGHRCHDADASCPSGRACLHRLCWNPSHLEAQTRQDNLLSGNTLAAAKARQTHCEAGHEFTPKNTRLRTRRGGGRVCRECDAIRQRERRRA